MTLPWISTQGSISIHSLAKLVIDRIEADTTGHESYAHIKATGDIVAKDSSAYIEAYTVTLASSALSLAGQSPAALIIENANPLTTFVNWTPAYTP